MCAKPSNRQVNLNIFQFLPKLLTKLLKKEK